MTTFEILKKEADNFNKIYLFKEGIFWKAYEKSAYIIIKYLQTFKITKKYVKCVDSDVLSIGFPDSTLKSLFQNYDIKNISSSQMEIVFEKSISKEDFSNWKSQILINKTIKTDNNIINDQGGLKEKILSFHIESKTPIECMLFLSSLIKEIQQDYK